MRERVEWTARRTRLYLQEKIPGTRHVCTCSRAVTAQQIHALSDPLTTWSWVPEMAKTRAARNNQVFKATEIRVR